MLDSYIAAINKWNKYYGNVITTKCTTNNMAAGIGLIWLDLRFKIVNLRFISMAGAGVFSMDDLLENDMNVAAGSISDDDCIEVE